MSFTIENFTADCLAVINHDSAQKKITELLSQAISKPSAIIDALGEPKEGKVEKLFVSDELTIINVIWAPQMSILPHNHNMWAVIGVYCGKEDNIFWRRIKGDNQGRIEKAAEKTLNTGESCPLGKNIIHSVTNPLSEFTGAIHVYGGNFFEMERSEWAPKTLEEQPYDIDKNMQLFKDANLGLPSKTINR